MFYGMTVTGMPYRVLFRRLASGTGWVRSPMRCSGVYARQWQLATVFRGKEAGSIELVGRW
jgi:hypothetical protein